MNSIVGKTIKDTTIHEPSETIVFWRKLLPHWALYFMDFP